MKFCTECGNRVSLTVPFGDTRKRHVCSVCGEVHYVNPKMVAGCLVSQDNKVLLCRRSISPRRNLWTLPGGFVEVNETLVEGAKRECLEEACAVVNVLGLYTIYDVPDIAQVYFYYRAEFARTGYSPGMECSDVRLFSEHELPWKSLAFVVVKDTLINFFRDNCHHNYPVRDKKCDSASGRIWCATS